MSLYYFTWIQLYESYQEKLTEYKVCRTATAREQHFSVLVKPQCLDWFSQNMKYNKYIHNVISMHTNPGCCKCSVSGRKQKNVFTRVARV